MIVLLFWHSDKSAFDIAFVPAGPDQIEGLFFTLFTNRYYDSVRAWRIASLDCEPIELNRAKGGL